MIKRLAPRIYEGGAQRRGESTMENTDSPSHGLACGPSHDSPLLKAGAGGGCAALRPAAAVAPLGRRPLD